MRIVNSARYGLVAVGIFGLVSFPGCEFNISLGKDKDKKPSTPPSTATTTTTNTSGSTTTTPSSAGKDVYESVSAGLTMEYPTDWETVPLSPPSVVAFVSPPESDEDIFTENVNMVTEDLTGRGITLAEYSEAALENVQSVIPDIKQVSYTSTTFMGQPAQKVIYTGSQQDIALQWMQIWTIAAEKAYVFTYTAEPKSFDAFLPQAQEIADSAKLN